MFSSLFFVNINIYYVVYTVYIMSVVHNPYETVVCKGEGDSKTALVW